MVLHQVSLSEPFHRPLITNGFVAILAKMARMTFGNTNMPKFCMQSLVRVIASVDQVEARAILTELLDYNIVSLISVCLRSDDVELIYWAAGLMHEFVLKDVAAAEFRQIKGVQTILLSLLTADEMYISRVVLRTIKFMAHGQEQFRLEMVRTGLITKIMHCLTSDDDDVRYWAILCIHDCAGQVEAQPDILSATEFPIMLELGSSNKSQASAYVADILSLICCLNSNNNNLAPHSEAIVATLNSLLMWEEPEIQYNAAGALFNMMAMSDDYTALICSKCLNSFITVILETNRERVQLTCAKALLMLGIRDNSLITRIILQVIEPLMARFVELCYQATPVFIAGLTLERKVNVVKYTAPALEDADVDSIKEELPDYISITPGGYISNAARLEQRLQAVARPRDAQSESLSAISAAISQIPAIIPNSSPREVFRAAYDRYMTNNSGEGSSSSQITASTSKSSNLPPAEITSAYKEKMLGTLNSLRVLTENEIMFSQVLSGSIFEGMIAGMQAVERMMDIIAEQYSESGEDDESTSEKRQSRKKSPPVTGDAFRDFDTDISKGSRRGSDGFKHTVTLLPDTVQSFVDSLVHLTVLPAINIWAVRYNMCITSAQMDYDTAREKIVNLLDIVNKLTFVSQGSSPISTSVAAIIPPTMGDIDNAEDVVDHPVESGKEDDDSDQLRRLTSAFSPTKNCGKDAESQTPPGNFTTSAGIPKLRKSTIPFATRALLSIRSLVRYAPVRNYLEQEVGFISIMINLYHECRSLSESVMLCLGIMVLSADPTSKLLLSNVQLLTPVIWRNILSTLSQTYTIDFYSRSMLVYCRELSSYYRQQTWEPNEDSFLIENHESKTYVHLEREEHSKLCVVDIENWLEVRNDSWTFETLQATHGTPLVTDTCVDKCFAYELEPCTDGLIQVGWASKEARFDPEGGMGVGDDDYSYAFDGCRAQKWHGRWSDERSTYGQEWNAGDVITCLVDLEAGTMSYHRNGVDMGVAFERVACDKAWYPAISVSTSQGCKVYFGGEYDPLRYAPPGYKGIASLSPSAVSLVLPPPHIKLPANTEGRVSRRGSSSSDLSGISSVEAAQDEAISIEDPEASVENTTGEQGSLPLDFDGNVEPNLVPVDKISSWDTTPVTTTSEEPRFNTNDEHNLEINSYDWNCLLPSLYFEVELHFRRVSEFDIGDDKRWFSRIGMTDLAMRMVAFEYNILEKHGRFVFQSAEYHFSSSVLCDLNDGDVVGFLFDCETATAGLTINGIPQHYIQLPSSLLFCAFRPYVPHLEGPCRSRFNYGQRSFLYSIANDTESTKKMIGYLDSVVTAPYK
ncbi:hypothetical protein BC943DRAFT_10443 [Umbelopsis sp. AD052]|nr:hypothetical protein BC943DRAFT_10443 [Umbelopsis sp. AD052]